MKKSEVFATLKEANRLVDIMTTVDDESQTYADASEALYYTLDALTMGYHPWYSVHMSKRTGHYYIKLSA